MKNKSMFSNLHLASCILYLVFILLPIAHSLSPVFVYAQPAKGADKTADVVADLGLQNRKAKQSLQLQQDKSAAANLPSIIKKIDIPWPASAAVDEKENRLFVMSAAGDSAVFVINGKDNSVIKKISIKPPDGFSNNAAGNGIAFNPNTKRLYAVLDAQKSVNVAAVIDTKSYKVLSLIKNPREKERLTTRAQPAAINLSKRHNMVYAVAETNPYGYVFVFNGGSNKFVEEVALDRRGFFSEISEDGDFLYIVGREFMKFDIKAKKFVASLPINVSSVPFIDEKNGLIFAASAYKLYIIDLKTFKLKDEREDIPVSSGGSGFSIALNPTTNHLFVPTYQDSVSVIDVPTMKILTTLKVGQTVKSIAVNSKTNRVYVTLVNVENKVVVIQDR